MSRNKRSFTMKNQEGPLSLKSKAAGLSIVVSPLTKKYTAKGDQMASPDSDMEGSVMDDGETESGAANNRKKKNSLVSPAIKAKKSVSAVDQMAAIFSKPLEEREKSDKDKIVQFLRNGVPFLAEVQIPLLSLLSDKLEPISLKAGEISKLTVLCHLNNV